MCDKTRMFPGMEDLAMSMHQEGFFEEVTFPLKLEGWVRSKPKWKSLSRVQLFVTPWLYSPWNSPGQNAGVVASPFATGSS